MSPARLEPGTCDNEPDLVCLNGVSIGILVENATLDVLMILKGIGLQVDDESWGFVLKIVLMVNVVVLGQ